jgi:hypothetical protein
MSEMTEQQLEQSVLEECITKSLLKINIQATGIIDGNESNKTERTMNGAVFQDIPDFGMIAMQAGLCRWVWERDLMRDLIHSLEEVWDRVVDVADTQDLRLIRDIQKVNGKLENVRQSGVMEKFIKHVHDASVRFQKEAKA